MKNLLKYAVLGLALAMGSSNMAHADGLLGFLFGDPPPSNPPANTAPEVDPGLAISALGLLGGTLTVMRSRRSTKSDSK